MSDDLTISVADFAEKHTPAGGDLFLVKLPAGLGREEIAEAASQLQRILNPYGASAVILTGDMTIEKYRDEMADWVAENGLAVRGMQHADGTKSFHVIHARKGRLSAGATWMEAVERARLKAVPAPPPTSQDTREAQGGGFQIKS